MAVVIDATPGGPAANSFADVAWANTYFESRLFGDAWDDVDDDDKSKGLVTATRLIIEEIIRRGVGGWPTTAAQALPFPRVGLYDRNNRIILSSIVPNELKAATAEYALKLVQAGKMPDEPSQTDGIKSFSAGPVDIEFSESESYTSVTALPEAIISMISFLLNGGSVGGSSISVPLVRV